LGIWRFGFDSYLLIITLIRIAYFFPKNYHIQLAPRSFSEIDHEAALEAANATAPEASDPQSPATTPMEQESPEPEPSGSENPESEPSVSAVSAESASGGPEDGGVESEPPKPRPKIVSR